MGSQRAGHDLVPRQQQQQHTILIVEFSFFKVLKVTKEHNRVPGLYQSEWTGLDCSDRQPWHLSG